MVLLDRRARGLSTIIEDFVLHNDAVAFPCQQSYQDHTARCTTNPPTIWPYLSPSSGRELCKGPAGTL